MLITTRHLYLGRPVPAGLDPATSCDFVKSPPSSCLLTSPSNSWISALRPIDLIGDWLTVAWSDWAASRDCRFLRQKMKLTTSKASTTSGITTPMATFAPVDSEELPEVVTETGGAVALAAELVSFGPPEDVVESACSLSALRHRTSINGA